MPKVVRLAERILIRCLTYFYRSAMAAMIVRLDCVVLLSGLGWLGLRVLVRQGGCDKIRHSVEVGMAAHCKVDQAASTFYPEFDRVTGSGTSVAYPCGKSTNGVRCLKQRYKRGGVHPNRHNGIQGSPAKDRQRRRQALALQFANGIDGNRGYQDLMIKTIFHANQYLLLRQSMLVIRRSADPDLAVRRGHAHWPSARRTGHTGAHGKGHCR